MVNVGIGTMLLDTSRSYKRRPWMPSIRLLCINRTATHRQTLLHSKLPETVRHPAGHNRIIRILAQLAHFAGAPSRRQSPQTTWRLGRCRNCSRPILKPFDRQLFPLRPSLQKRSCVCMRRSQLCRQTAQINQRTNPRPNPRRNTAGTLLYHN